MQADANGKYKVEFDGDYGHPLFTDDGKTATDTAMIFTKEGFPATAYQWFAGRWQPFKK